MVIADPGIFMQLDFDAENDVKKIEINYGLIIHNSLTEYDAELKWIMDGGNDALDLNWIYNFFVPFIDNDFLGGTDEVDFQISIKYDDDITLSYDGPNTLKTEPGYELSPNHYMKKEGESSEVEIYDSTHESGYELQDSTFQVAGEGVSGKLSYDQSGANFDTSLEKSMALILVLTSKLKKEFLQTESKNMYFTYPIQS